MNFFSNRVNAVFGNGCFNMLLEELEAERGNILLLTGGKSVSAVKSRIAGALTGKNYVHIDSIAPNPDISHIFASYKKIRDSGFSPGYVIAIGGGSVLDTAKALKALLGMEIDNIPALRRIIEEKSYSPVSCRLILCPTSAGTGSEVTKWATVWGTEGKCKYSVEHEALYADKVYIDPALTYSLPYKQSVYCAFDAFSHAVESYWSPASCTVSREYSLKALELFERVIDDFIDDSGGSPWQREVLSACGYFAGLAFSHTRTTVCHAISYPLTLLYGVPHGIAACLSVPAMLEINADALTEKERLLNVLNISNAVELRRKTYERLKRAGIPFKLSDYGFCEGDISVVAAKCFTPGRTDNNPVKIGLADIEKILGGC